MDDYDICVIGAGISGLYTCKKLLKLHPELKIVLVEGSDRTGGRTLSIDGFDLGGQWIGPTQTEIIKLVNHYKLELVEQKVGDNFLSKIELEFAGLTTKNNPEVTKYVRKLYKLEYDPSLAFISAYDHITSCVKSKYAIELLKLFVESITSMSAKKLNMLYFLYDLRSSGSEDMQKWFIKGGSQQLCELMLRDLLNDGYHIDVYFDTMVNKVKHFGNIKKCIVTSTDNDKFVCSKVIFCISPLYIKNIDIDLPKNKKQLFNGMVSPTAVKIVLIYSEKFWEEERKVPVHFLLKGPMTNIYEYSTNVLVGLITGENAIKFTKMSPKIRYYKILKQIELLYNYKTKPLLCYQKIWEGCYAGSYEPGLYYNFKELGTPVGNHYYFASSDTSTKFMGYIEGALRSADRVVKQIQKYLD